MPRDNHPALVAVEALRLQVGALASAVETARHEQREAVDAADLDRAAVALERAEKAISDLDAEIRIARALLAYATGEWAE